MDSNFDFLKSEWSVMYDRMQLAESRVYTEPISTASYCRTSIEESLYHIYEAECLELPYNTELFNLMKNGDIEQLIPYQLLNGIHYSRKIGNSAAHYNPRKISGEEALISIKYTFSFLKWFANNYSKVKPDLPGPFNESLVPKESRETRSLHSIKAEAELKQQTILAELEVLKKAHEAALEKARESEADLARYKAVIHQQKEAIQQQRAARKTKISSEFSESETRKHLIDAELKSAGWEQLRPGRELEFPVTGMPITTDNPQGNGRVDYVLWDDNGKPLALVEAKRTSIDVEAGKHQAFLYANCLENMYEQRPVIFYSNGFETKIWDDTFYTAPRRVYGFYNKAELKLLIQRRKTRKDIRKADINPSIAGRPYQMEAIQRISEAFVVDGYKGLAGDKRNALLVMATGSGKTRTAAALVDVLFKHNWAKRVLFLADRNALVTQAKNNFSEYLPELSSIDLTQEKEVNTTRLVFSTYPTMMNLIDRLQTDAGRFYGVGHFDLIIIDEAHRSVYNKYGAIFEYFDSLVVGLTATPKDSIDHNTFELFDCPSGDPTFSFELDEAVPQYLVPYRNFNVTTEFLRSGIRYKDLSEEDKEKYEEEFRDNESGLFPEEISNSELNKWLFNKDTVNKILDNLITNGLKIEGGDKLGRTIIFAVNHNHSKFIVECFQERYPELPPAFISMVHNKVSHAQSLIEAFCDEYQENDPQIAVSVDMMDTGIDAPRVLNLVFFKPVRSYAKFWQMIGRGTRLCPDVFGPGMPKTEFLIFDSCGNFEFFEESENTRESSTIKSLSQQIFEARLHLIRLQMDSANEENLELAATNMDILHQEIAKLRKARFQVKMKLQYVDRYADRERWNQLNSGDVHIIETHLSSLPEPKSEHENIRRFELMMLKMQQAQLLGLGSLRGYCEKLRGIADRLKKLYTIPEVKQHKKLIDELADENFYQELSQKKLESVRIEIRDLMKYLKAESIEPVYTNLEDSDIAADEGIPIDINPNRKYKDRVERFIRENKDQLVIHKIISNEQITIDEIHQLEKILFDGDERGTKEDFIREYGEEPLAKFVRQILGLSAEAANEAFGELLNSQNLRADQIKFLRTLISFLTVNGTIDKQMLFEPPFTDQNDQGLLGVFEDEVQAQKVISIIDEINERGSVG
ncbi:MAG: DEAD/DEAH box helicase family protein [Bacteroidota bacterium]